MKIREVYEKYKDRDKYILSSEWAFRNDLKDDVLREMWRAIKEEVEEEKWAEG